MLECDFCGAEMHSYLDGWLYATKPTAREIVPGVIVEDADGLWLACDDCAILIEQAKVEELTERSARAYFSKHPTLPENQGIIRQHMYETQADFWRGRLGILIHQTTC
jgi:hypothetical protein